MNSVQLIGLLCPGLNQSVKEHRNACPGCLRANMLFSAKNPFSKDILKEHGPDDLIAALCNQVPLSTVIIDQTGPLYYPDGSGPGKYFSAYVLIAVELITYRAHLSHEYHGSNGCCMRA